jgi:hypothetical protein
MPNSVDEPETPTHDAVLRMSHRLQLSEVEAAFKNLKSNLGYPPDLSPARGSDRGVRYEHWLTVD